MGKMTNIEFWKQPSIRNKLVRLCKSSVKETIDWEKFREKDVEHMFDSYHKYELKIKYQKITRKRAGLCVVCGINKSMPDRTLCEECKRKNSEKMTKQKEEMREALRFYRANKKKS